MKKYFHKRNKFVVPLVLILLGVVGEKKHFHLNFIYSLKARIFKTKKKHQIKCVFSFHFLWWEKEIRFAVDCVQFEKKTTVFVVAAVFLLLLLLNVVLFCSVLQQLNVFCCCYWANSMLKMCLLVTQRAAEIEFDLIWILNQPQLKYTGSWCRFLCLQFAILLSTSWWHWITKYNQISCPENASLTIHRLINAVLKAYIVLLKWSDVYRIAYIDFRLLCQIFIAVGSCV